MGAKSEKIKDYAEKLGGIASSCKVDSIVIGKPNSKRIPTEEELNAYTAGIAVGCSIVSMYAEGSVADDGTPYAENPMDDFENAICIFVRKYSEISARFSGGDAA